MLGTLGPGEGETMARKTKAPSPAARTRARTPRAAARQAIRLSLQLPSTKKAIVEAVRRVMKAASEMRCGRSERADMEIVLREALANAIFHGNAGDPGKKVRLRCSFSRSRGMILSIRDEGRGFDPGEVPDPRESERLFLHHGRGLFLMRELMDRVEHRDGGREIVLYKEPRVERAGAKRSSGRARR